MNLYTGCVENRKDPMKLGRCQVRVVGVHTHDKTILPTADLPWSTPVFPINNSSSWSAPLVGDWILGFFMDGENAQFPVMLGVIPYIKDNPTDDKQVN